MATPVTLGEYVFDLCAPPLFRLGFTERRVWRWIKEGELDEDLRIYFLVWQGERAYKHVIQAAIWSAMNLVKKEGSPPNGASGDAPSRP